MQLESGKVKKWAVIGFVAIVLITAFLLVDSHYTKIELEQKTFEAGDKVDLAKYLKAKNQNSTVEVRGVVDTSVLGKQKVKYEVRGGIFKHVRNVTVNIVDTTKPKIVGPDSINIIYGDKVSINDYYDVEDFQEDIDSYLVPEPSISSLKPGTFDVNLSVTDNQGNFTSKKIKVTVEDVSEEEHKVLECIRMYEEEGGKIEKLGKYAYCYHFNEKDFDNKYKQSDDLIEYIIIIGEDEMFTKTKMGKLEHIKDYQLDEETWVIYYYIALEKGEKIKLSKFINKSV